MPQSFQSPMVLVCSGVLQEAVPAELDTQKASSGMSARDKWEKERSRQVGFGVGGSSAVQVCHLCREGAERGGLGGKSLRLRGSASWQGAQSRGPFSESLHWAGMAWLLYPPELPGDLLPQDQPCSRSQSWELPANYTPCCRALCKGGLSGACPRLLPMRLYPLT